MPSVSTDPWKLDELAHVDTSYKSAASEVKNEAVRPPAAAFIANIDRVRATAELSILSTGLTFLQGDYYYRRLPLLDPGGPDWPPE
jgi:hypothetical protein